MIEYFAKLRHGDRDEGIRCAAQRLGLLVLTTDLSSLTRDQFGTLCQLFNGISTAQRIAAKEALCDAIGTALAEQAMFRDELAELSFSNDAPETRTCFMRKLDREQNDLIELGRVIDILDDRACLAVLTRIEEVHAETGVDLEARCTAVYDKMQARCRL